VQPLCSIDFSKDAKRPTRVDNEAKACLDEISLTLQQHPDETVVVVGEAAGNEAQGATGYAAHRAVNTKEYLTTEKGIDPSRITVVTGGDATQGVQDYLVPQGANFNNDVPNTTPVDENQVKPEERKPLPVRSQAKKQPAAKTPPDAKKKPAGAAAPAQAPTGP
jgi:ribosomal protein S11